MSFLPPSAGGMYHSFDAELESSLSPKPITEHAVDILTDDDIESNPRKRKGRSAEDSQRTKKKKRSEEDAEENKAKIKKSRFLTDKFRSIKEKVHKLERLTPTWDWQFEVEKNSFNSRSTKHKYKSSDKASDLPKRVSVDRLSRYFKECLNEVKKIEQLDNDFVVTLRAYKPEGETNRKKNIHEYITQAESDSAPDGSQPESTVSSENSEEILSSQDIDREVFTLSCRICRDDVFIQDVPSYVACLKPAGKAHYAAHLHCLGLYTSNKSERMDVRSWYKCPAHV